VRRFIEAQQTWITSFSRMFQPLTPNFALAQLPDAGRAWPVPHRAAAASLAAEHLGIARMTLC
jgi:hypothetical protein